MGTQRGEPHLFAKSRSVQSGPCRKMPGETATVRVVKLPKFPSRKRGEGARRTLKT